MNETKEDVKNVQYDEVNEEVKNEQYDEVPELVRNRKGFKVVKGDNNIIFVDVFNKNVNYVLELKDKSLAWVENKSIALGKRADDGKKLKHTNIVKIYRYVAD